jgi:omega-amidase
MNVGLIQMAVARGDRGKNYDRVEGWVDKCLGLHPRPDLIVLPELWSTGYALRELDTLASDEGLEEAEFLGRLSRKYGVWFAGGSVAAKTTRGIVNRAQIINRKGRLEATYDKVHLVPMLDEHKYLIAGDSHLVHGIEGINFGFVICYDIRFCEFLRKLALQGAQALIVSAEWPLVRLAHWQALLKARAIENQYFVLASNNVALEGTPFAGHSVAHAPDGSAMCQFDFAEGVKVVRIDVTEVETMRKNVPVFKDRRPELY